MADKATKKTVAISIKRERQGVPKIIVATGFKLRPDKGTGLIDVLLEGAGQKGLRVSVDPVLLRSNPEGLKRYAASVGYDQDDAAQKDDVIVSDEGNFANMVHVSQMGGRAETVFGVFSLSDWVEATRQPESGKSTPEIKSIDSVVAISTAGVQKKLVLELLTMLSQQTEQ